MAHPNRKSDGYMPPQAIDLEEAVLGACLIDKRAMINAVKYVRAPEFFYKSEHSKIYAVLLDMHKNGEAIDLLTVSQALRKKEHLQAIGGDSALIALSQKVNSSAHIQHHGRILLEKFMLRQIITLSMQITSDAYMDDGDIFEILSSMTKGITAIQNETNVGKEKPFEAIVREAMDDVQRLSQPNAFTGFDTGFPSINQKIGGWQKGELIVIGARPGMGKTAFALKTMSSVAKTIDEPCVMISYEMRDVAMVKRLMAIESPTLHSNQLFRDGLKKDEYWKELIDVAGELEGRNLIILDSMPNIYQLGMDLRRIKHERGLGLVVIDYLQLIPPEKGGRQNGNRDQDIGEITRELKKLSLELDIPIIALSQLSRKCEETPSKIPGLRHLRESGNIEQDADMIAFLYRAEYYFPDQDPDVAVFICEKQRNGALFNQPLGWNKNKAKFYDNEGAQEVDEPF